MCIQYYQGKRIFLRPLEMSDEPLLRRWLNDPENWKTLNRFLPVSEHREREFLEGLYKSCDDVALGVVLRDGERLIGVTGLHRVNAANRSAVFGIIIGERDYQSRAYGTETTQLMLGYGFRELNLNRIGLSVYADNERAIRAYRRVGFVQEGCLRQAFFRNGRYHDELCFSILRDEWARSCEQDDKQDLENTGEDDGHPVVQLASMTMWDTRVSA